MNISDYEQLFRANYGKFCAVANSVVKDEKAAEDIVQDVFVRLWKNREHLNIQTSLDAYLYRAVLNTALNHMEKKKPTVPLPEVADLPDSVDAAENEAAGNELAHQINNSIDRLPPKCKAIFVLSRFEGKTYPEIAMALQISVKTVENQMGKALKLLREYLSDFL